MIAIFALACLTAAGVIGGAFLNRFRGGWPEGGRSRGFRRLTTLVSAAAPYAAAIAGLCVAAGRGPVETAAWAVGVLVATAILTSEGHGEQMDGGRSDEATERPNKIDYVVAALYWAFRKKADYGDPTFELTGLALTGVLIHLPVSVAAIWHGHWLVGALFLVAGTLKAPAYEIAHEKLGGLPFGLSSGPDALGRNIETGEAVWGATTYGLLALMMGGAALVG